MKYTPEQQKENVKLWTAALRSEKYAQRVNKNDFDEKGSGDLCRNGFYCCTGVLCEVAGVEKETLEDGDDIYVSYAGKGRFLPEEAMAFVGLSSDTGRYGNTSLSYFNDVARLTFDQIADIIDSEPEGLFTW